MDVNSDFNLFIQLHQPQLLSSGVPQIFWKTLFEKLTLENFDSGDTFQLTQIDYGDDERDPYDVIFQLQIKLSQGISANDPSQIYLVDHAWTYRVDQAKSQLQEHEGLLQRMCSIMGIPSSQSKEHLVNAVFEESWRYANTYFVANAENVEDRVPVWYIMDEVGSAMQHSDTPNFRMVPFIFLSQNITYSLIFPIKDCEFTDVITRNFVEKDHSDERNALLIPWIYTDLTHLTFKHLSVTPDYFLSGHIKESLPVLENLNVPKANGFKKTFKVFSEYKFIHEYLTDANFKLVDNEEDADILWYTSHFKAFEQLSNSSPWKFVNQFPFEYILTIKDLLCIVCRMKNTDDFVDMKTLQMQPKWLPVTYNLNTEVTQFVSYFQNREAKNMDNHWIIKPFNLARGLDTHITKNLNCILRLQTSGPKIAQKYIEKPVVFARSGIGKVKFDIRYVILLKSVKPLQVYVYNNFFLRFANEAFSLDDLHIYEKHFTVMNYNEQAVLKRMLCVEFKDEWREQFETSWDSVEKSITSMLKEVFECATTEPPPCGISENPQSRALYAADIMLAYDDAQIIPKLLEINWMPDCKRACEYYPDFYNDIFKLLFLEIENNEVFTKL